MDSSADAINKPIVLSMLNTPVSEGVLQADGADLTLAQQAMNKVIMYEQGVTATPNNIFIAIDVEPLEFFELIGLSTVEDNDHN